MNLTEAVAQVPPGTTPMFMIAEGCHPQTIAVVRTRAEARSVQTVIADPAGFEFRPGVIGALLQYPTTDGKIEDYRAFCDRAHAAGGGGGGGGRARPPPPPRRGGTRHQPRSPPHSHFSL